MPRVSRLKQLNLKESSIDTSDFSSDSSRNIPSSDLPPYKAYDQDGSTVVEQTGGVLSVPSARAYVQNCHKYDLLADPGVLICLQTGYYFLSRMILSTQIFSI